MATTTQTAAAISPKNNWPCFNAVAVWKNWKEDTTVMKVVKLVGNLLVFPLIIAGFFDVVKKSYDFVWGKKEEKPVKEPEKPVARSVIRKAAGTVKNTFTWTADKAKNIWVNHKKPIIIGAAAVAVGGVGWCFSGYLAASVCNLTGYFCAATTSQPTSQPNLKV